jgi:hypothetical protein
MHGPRMGHAYKQVRKENLETWAKARHEIRKKSSMHVLNLLTQNQ